MLNDQAPSLSHYKCNLAFASLKISVMQDYIDVSTLPTSQGKKSKTERECLFTRRESSLVIYTHAFTLCNLK